MLILFLKDYGEVQAGEVRDTKTDEDAQTLIDSGVAMKHIAVEPKDNSAELEKIADDIEKKVREELKAEAKSENKIPAQPKGEYKAPWSSLGDFAKSTVNGKADVKLMNYCNAIDKSTGMNIAINADGGFLIPEEFTTALLTAMAQSSVIAPKCTNFPVNNNLKLPFVNITTQATSWTGGMTIYKPAEGIAKTASLPQFAKCELNLHKMTGVVYATDELLEDSPQALETFLTTMAATEFALTKDEDIINGSGAGEALGVLKAPCLISVTKETNQVATTIVTENVVKMFSRMYGPGANKAVWLIAQDAIPQIAQLSITVGTGGAPVFIADLKNPLGPSLLGRPIIWSPHCQTLGQVGDIIFGDFSQYVTITKQGQGMKTATSIHLKFLENETCFRFEIRCDGQPWWASAITPKHGSSTVSPFVALAVRE
jgi:HK97 family phage major capsid protein